MIVSRPQVAREEASGPSVSRFRADVLRGLAARAKEIPPKYFYDEAGSALFEQITTLEEYYLTRTEQAIMRRHAAEMGELLGPRCQLIEYGSGSSSKTRLLLDHLEDPAGYVPVDISRDHLLRSAEALSTAYPNLEVLPLYADFTGPITVPSPRLRASKRIVYFPGSTIGNLVPLEAVALLRNTAKLFGAGGGLLLGADLKKDPSVLEAAYNDRRGVTAAFNLNLLVRINRELGGDFVVSQFAHHSFYNASAGRIEMHLVSQCVQHVQIGDSKFPFAQGESIHTENSYKYSLGDLRRLAAAAGLVVAAIWMHDSRQFSVSYLTSRD
jgi:dimethylhistidine N-methyltransferase